MERVEKNLPSQQVTVYASWWMASNNENALPLEENDRRIGVLQNAGPLHDNKALYEAIRAFQTGEGGYFSAGFIATVAGFLAARDVSKFDPMAPAPMFTGKRKMIDLNTTAVDDVVEDILAHLPDDYLSFKTLESHAKSKLSMNEMPVNLREHLKIAMTSTTWLCLGKEKLGKKGNNRVLSTSATKRRNRFGQDEMGGPSRASGEK